MIVECQLYKLSAKFIIDYPSNLYPELLSKEDRPHYCILVETHCDYFLCIPFRSNIEHNNAFKFKNTLRSQTSQSGLDYSKMVILKDTNYLDDSNIVIDKDEYKTTIKCYTKIANQAIKYLEKYINHIQGTHILNSKEYDRLYKYSTLPYFHNILNLPVIHSVNKILTVI